MTAPTAIGFTKSCEAKACERRSQCRVPFATCEDLFAAADVFVQPDDDGLDFFLPNRRCPPNCRSSRSIPSRLERVISGGAGETAKRRSAEVDPRCAGPVVPGGDIEIHSNLGSLAVLDDLPGYQAKASATCVGCWSAHDPQSETIQAYVALMQRCGRQQVARASKSIGRGGVMTTRVVLLIPTMDRGGAEKQLCLLAENLPRDRFDVHVMLLTRDGPRSERLRTAEIPVTLIGKRFKADPSALFRLRRELVRLKPDIVHTWLFAANSFGRAAARLARCSQDHRQRTVRRSVEDGRSFCDRSSTGTVHRSDHDQQLRGARFLCASMGSIRACFESFPTASSHARRRRSTAMRPFARLEVALGSKVDFGGRSTVAAKTIIGN